MSVSTERAMLRLAGCKSRMKARCKGGRAITHDLFDKDWTIPKTSSMDAQLDNLKYDPNGLIPAIVQDNTTGEVLVMFWMNQEALAKTIETGKVHSYSRSRKRLA